MDKALRAELRILFGLDPDDNDLLGGSCYVDLDEELDEVCVDYTVSIAQFPALFAWIAEEGRQQC